MPAPPGNENAVKRSSDKATSFLHIRAVPREKAAWVRAANRSRQNLAQWVTDQLNRAAISADIAGP
jgi:hypothetical protein